MNRMVKKLKIKIIMAFVVAGTAFIGNFGGGKVSFADVAVDVSQNQNLDNVTNVANKVIESKQNIDSAFENDFKFICEYPIDEYGVIKCFVHKRTNVPFIVFPKSFAKYSGVSSFIGVKGDNPLDPYTKKPTMQIAHYWEHMEASDINPMDYEKVTYESIFSKQKPLQGNAFTDRFGHCLFFKNIEAVDAAIQEFKKPASLCNKLKENSDIFKREILHVKKDDKTEKAIFESGRATVEMFDRLDIDNNEVNTDEYKKYVEEANIVKSFFNAGLVSVHDEPSNMIAAGSKWLYEEIEKFWERTYGPNADVRRMCIGIVDLESEKSSPSYESMMLHFSRELLTGRTSSPDDKIDRPRTRDLENYYTKIDCNLPLKYCVKSNYFDVGVDVYKDSAGNSREGISKNNSFVRYDLENISYVEAAFLVNFLRMAYSGVISNKTSDYSKGFYNILHENHFVDGGIFGYGLDSDGVTNGFRLLVDLKSDTDENITPEKLEQVSEKLLVYMFNNFDYNKNGIGGSESLYRENEKITSNENKFHELASSYRFMDLAERLLRPAALNVDYESIIKEFCCSMNGFGVPIHKRDCDNDLVENPDHIRHMVCEGRKKFEASVLDAADHSKVIKPSKILALSRPSGPDFFVNLNKLDKLTRAKKAIGNGYCLKLKLPEIKAEDGDFDLACEKLESSIYKFLLSVVFSIYGGKLSNDGLVYGGGCFMPICVAKKTADGEHKKIKKEIDGLCLKDYDYYVICRTNFCSPSFEKVLSNEAIKQYISTRLDNMLANEDYDCLLDESLRNVDFILQSSQKDLEHIQELGEKCNKYFDAKGRAYDSKSWVERCIRKNNKAMKKFEALKKVAENRNLFFKILRKILNGLEVESIEEFHEEKFVLEPSLN